jgi:hypothetical protein
MMMLRSRLFGLATLLVFWLIAACGGGDSPAAPTATATVVPTATTGLPSPTSLAEPPSTPTAMPPASPTATPPATATATTTPEAEAVIAIEGASDFVAWTEQALQLIASNAPEWYEQVTASILTIAPVAAGSGMDVFNKVYRVGEVTAYAPGFSEAQQLVWYAGTIVHDSCHSERYDLGLVYLGKEGEVACLMDQKAALLLLDTGTYFSDYVQSLIDGADDPANAYWTAENRHW